MNFLQNSKLLILIVVVLVLVIIVSLISLRITPRQGTGLPPSPSPTPTSASVINPAGLEKNYQRIAKRQPLPANSLEIKKNLINRSKNNSGVLVKTNDFQVEYVEPMDLFMIQIKNINTEQTKSEAFLWFKNQGLDNQSVCNLPIMFYLNSDVSFYLQKNSLQFNPQPKECN